MTPEQFNRANEIHDREKDLNGRLSAIKLCKDNRLKIHPKYYQQTILFEDKALEQRVYDMAISKIEAELIELKKEFDNL